MNPDLIGQQVYFEGKLYFGNYSDDYAGMVTIGGYIQYDSDTYYTIITEDGRSTDIYCESLHDYA